jgi:hypothetical protein
MLDIHGQRVTELIPAELAAELRASHHGRPLSPSAVAPRLGRRASWHLQRMWLSRGHPARCPGGRRSDGVHLSLLSRTCAHVCPVEVLRVGRACSSARDAGRDRQAAPSRRRLGAGSPTELREAVPKPHEVADARAEGVHVAWLTEPVRFLVVDRLAALGYRGARMRLDRDLHHTPASAIPRSPNSSAATRNRQDPCAPRVSATSRSARHTLQLRLRLASQRRGAGGLSSARVFRVFVGTCPRCPFCRVLVS